MIQAPCYHDTKPTVRPKTLFTKMTASHETIEFSREGMLSFLYCFVVKEELISTKSFPPVGFKLATPTAYDFHPHAYPSVLDPISCKIETL